MTNKERTLKKIHNFIYKFGLDVSLVKKEENIDAIAYNSLENMNKYWASQKNELIWDSPEYTAFYRGIIQILETHKIQFNDKSWADVGCGSGTLFHYLKQSYNAKSIHGFEAVQSAIDISQKRIPEGKFEVYDLYTEPKNQFDLIFCTEVLEHLLHPEIALKNLQKHMHDNSCLVITVPNGRIDTWGGHINYWSPESWNTFIEINVDGKRFETGKFENRVVWAIIYGKDYK